MLMRFACWTFATIVLALACASAQDGGVSAYWTFDSTGAATNEQVANHSDAILGNFSYTAGVRGQALKFDSFTTRISREGKEAPAIRGAFTISAWIAPQA